MRYLVLLLLILTACAPNIEPGPRLVQDVTLVPRTLTNTRVPSATSETDILPTLMITATPMFSAAVASPSGAGLPAVTSELNSPLEVVTVQADFIFVTPTLPPSKTPTETPTITTTPTISPTPSMTATDTATAPIFPTSVFTPTPAPVINPLPQVCDTLWPWLPIPPTGCPLTRPTARNGVFQSFTTGPGASPGYMFWVDFPPYAESPDNDIEGDDTIYVLYGDGTWEKHADFFVDPPPAGPPSTEPVLDNDRPGWCFPQGMNPLCYQPARGFGLLWRNSYYTDRRIYNKIGWGSIPAEIPYQSLKYYEEPMMNGTIYLNDPQENVFALFSYGRWIMYGSQSAIPPMMPTQANGWIPIPGLP